MFTFGRDKELAYALDRFGSEERAALLLTVVNAICDFLEGNIVLSKLEYDIAKAFKEGKSGIWEATGTWLLKFNKDYPSTLNVWRKLSIHKSATVRFRVASFLTDIEFDLANELYSIFTTDKSKKVREHAQGKWDFQQNPGKYA